MNPRLLLNPSVPSAFRAIRFDTIAGKTVLKEIRQNHGEKDNSEPVRTRERRSSNGP